MSKMAGEKDSYFVIKDPLLLAGDIRERVMKSYKITFGNLPNYMTLHDKNLLTDDIILFWLNQYIVFNKKEYRVDVILHYIDYDLLIERCFKEYCEIILNKMVDVGEMHLMWDNKKKGVYWKKKEV
jgi:hypothetical protein